ncbi:TPA: type II restriction endonuclease subunit R, partial [Candidatus Poribacteria bacterium]|nr:type II restriction endonuclease subunit R [Candidatus Poribacteria bacterium]
FSTMGRNKYLKLPKPGTNPRGVELSKEALLRLIEDKRTQAITIKWRRRKIDYNPYKRWVDAWKKKTLEM